MYIALDEPVAGLIPLGYGLFSLLSLALFGLTRRYPLFRFSQLALILMLPFLLMLALGGFINGSAVIIWSLICPLGALLFDRPGGALRWFAAWVGLVFLSGLITPYLRVTNNLSPPVITFFFVLNLSVVGAIVFSMVAYFIGQKNAFQERSEALLLNILPAEIAAVLRAEPRTIADRYDGASILFADVVDFTPLSAGMAPTAMVEMLDAVFSAFDDLVDKYEVEKIKTIGDCYMAAAGVPRPRADHAQVLARLGLEMQETVRTRAFGGCRLVFRIGINSGPVVAGVIGRKKFIYDLWGDAVNTASRMESHGSAGAVQITRATYELVRDEFVCEPRGSVPVKGKGDMDVWHVIRERSRP
jgi:guanylate cyclase